MVTGKREVKYDILRIMACFSVVLLHVSNSYWYTVDVFGSDFFVMTIYNSFTRFAIPVFFMMSGTFLLDPEKKVTIRQMLSRVFKLIVVFYIWSAFYAFQSVLLNILRGGFGAITEEMWQNALVRLLNGNGHMWFLLDLIGFYVLTPVLRKICEDIDVLGYFLFLWVLLRFILTPLLPMLNLWLLLSLLNNIHFNIFVGFIGYYMGGYYLKNKNFSHRAQYVLYMAGIISLFLINLLTILNCRRSGDYDDHIFEPSNPLVLVYSVAVFIAFSSRKGFSVSPLAEQMIGRVAKLTFFVYLAHPFFISKFNLLGFNTLSFAAILSVPVLTILVIALCLLAGYCVSKIPFVGKWITYQ